VPGVNRSNYYGFSNVDIERIDSDAVTAIFSHDFGAAATIRNLTRWEDYDRYSITDADEGRICLEPTAQRASFTNRDTASPSIFWLS
jgi:catecholate siderophore receptor